MNQNNIDLSNITIRRQPVQTGKDSGVNMDDQEASNVNDPNSFCTILQNLLSEVRSIKDQNKNDFQKLEAQQNQFLKNTEKKIKLLESKFGAEINNVKVQLDQVVFSNNEQLSELKERINGLDASVSKRPVNNAVVLDKQLISQNQLPKIDLPTFSGKPLDNPMTFLTKIQQYFDIYAINESLKLLLLNNTLTDEAKLWWELMSNNLLTFDEFVVEFKNKYWSGNKQRKVLNKLRFGRYEQSGNLSRELYALQIYSFAKCLTPPLSERDILEYIKYHFEEGIGVTIINRGIETIGDLIKLLREHDEYNEGMRTGRSYERREERRPNNNNNNRGQSSNTQPPRNENNRTQNNRPPYNPTTTVFNSNATSLSPRESDHEPINTINQMNSGNM